MSATPLPPRRPSKPPIVKRTPQGTPSAWTDEELKALGSRLIGTKANVFEEATRSPGRHWQFTEKEFARMVALRKIFRCETCNVWFGMARRMIEADVCTECGEEG